MNNYLLSICIPTYNRQKEICTLLDDIFKYFKNSNIVEVCVSDNCSHGLDILMFDKYKNFKNFKLNINEQNIYFDGNLLKVSLMANGKYIFFLGDDDRINFNYLFEIINILKLNNNIDAIFTNYDVEIGTTKKFKNVYLNIKNRYNVSMNEVLELGHFITFMSSIIIKKTLINFQYVKKYIGYNFMHMAIVLSSLKNSNSVLIYENSLVYAFCNGLSDYDIEKYFDYYLMYIIDSEAFNYKKECIRKFKNSVFNFMFPTLIFNKKRNVLYYMKRYANTRVVFLLFPESFYDFMKKIKHSFYVFIIY